MEWIIEPVGNINRCDLVILPKSIAVGCSMNAEAFDKIFWANLTASDNNREAYEKAEQLHQQYFDHRKYSDYETYKSSKSHRLNK